MITSISGLPDNMAGFHSQGEVTKDDFEIVHKEVGRFVEETGKLNYLLFLDFSTSLRYARNRAFETAFFYVEKRDLRL